MAMNGERPCPSARLFLSLIVVCTLMACGGGDDGTGPDLDEDMDLPSVGQPPPVTQGNWYRPGVAADWQWQLQGNVNTGYDVEIYDIDLFDSPPGLITELHQAGRRVICYFSAGSFEDFRSDSSRFPASTLGNSLDGFADERWLDIRSGVVLEIMGDRLDLAVQKGCDGVEPDNVDGYTNNPGFPLTAADQLLFNRTLANEAHTRGLAVALKNDLGQVPELLGYFDFSVNEECHEFDSCALLSAFIQAGKPVLNAEYASMFVSSASARQSLCGQALAEGFQTLVLPLDLDDSFRFSC